MITKEQFISLIAEYLNFEAEISKLDDEHSIDLSDCCLVNFGRDLFNLIIDQSFNEDAVEDITWWLFDRDRKNTNPQMWKLKQDGTKEEIPTHTNEDLWNIVKNNRK